MFYGSKVNGNKSYADLICENYQNYDIVLIDLKKYPFLPTQLSTTLYFC